MTATPTTTAPLGQGVTGLTLDMLAERIEHEQAMRETREAAAAMALTTAMNSLDRRLEGMNEFRATLSDQSRDFLPRNEYEAKHAGLAGRVTLLERASERTAGAISTWRFLAGGGGILGLISIALWLLHPGAVT